ncbi:EamA family transporter [Parasphingorhabdus pacifica]
MCFTKIGRTLDHVNPRDRLLAAFVAVLWGCNFIAVDFGLRHFPPLFMAGARYAVVALVTVLFIPLPRVKWRWLVGYGIGFGILQFAFLFVAIDIGMPAGLASLVLQASAPLTVLLGGLLLRERISSVQLLGIGIAVLGMCVIGWHRAQNAAFLPVALTLCGALGWALGNLCNRRANPANPLHFSLWMSIVPPLPMFTVSWAMEGPRAGWQAMTTAFSSTEGLVALGGLAYVVLLGTVLGPAIWTMLMSRNPASVVAPFSLLIPVVGCTTAWLVLDQRPAPVELAAGAVVVGGVLLGSSSLGTRRRRTDPTPEPVPA